MKSHAKVVVIGGGAVGASILYHLAEAGISDTLLIEKNELTSGSTWHAAGNIPTYATSWLGMRAGNYAWQIYRDLAEKVGSPITYRHTGAFWPAHTKQRIELFQHLVGVSQSAGFELAILTPAEMEGMHPYWQANDTILGGIYDPYEGDIDPSQLTQALAKGARDKGAEIARFTLVTAISCSPTGEWKIQTDKGEVTAEIVVNAAGFYGEKIAAMVGQHLPVVTLEHQYLVTDQLKALEEDTDLFPLVRDPDIRFYLRRERSAFLFGSYAHAGRPVWPEGAPDEVAHFLFPDSVDDILEVLEQTIEHVPLLAEAGAQRFVNGPIAYSPDALPLVGPAVGLPNFYHATGVQIGITHSAAIGKAMAEWIVQGETEWDLAAWDPRRFDDWASFDYARQRASELYDLQYAIPYPHRILQAARPVKTTPLYQNLVNKGAVMGQIAGWERAFWFERDDIKNTGELSFHGEPWHAAVKVECENVRDHVGIMDHGGFTKFTVEGPDAEQYLSYIFCSAVPPVGRIRLSYLLTHKGRIWSEATIARISQDKFLLCGPTLTDLRDFDWLTQHKPDNSDISVRRGYHHDAALMVMGPESRELLSALTNADLSAQAMPWMSVAEIEIAGAQVTAMRVSYVGELGWELHLASNDLQEVYDAIWQQGQQHNICDFGSYALNAMRIEKGYHGWGSDFGTEYTLFDAGLAHFANLNKGEFIGRDQVIEQQRVEPQWTFIGLELLETGADAIASDPVIKDGECKGYVTSSTMGFRTGKQLALAFVHNGILQIGEECAVRVLGESRNAVRISPHVYDPENERLKS